MKSPKILFLHVDVVVVQTTTNAPYSACAEVWSVTRSAELVEDFEGSENVTMKISYIAPSLINHLMSVTAVTAARHATLKSMFIMPGKHKLNTKKNWLIQELA